MKRSVSPAAHRVLVVLAIIIAYSLSRVIYRTTGFPFTMLADQPAVLRFGADVAMWLLICGVTYRVLYLVAARAWADRPPRS